MFMVYIRFDRPKTLRFWSKCSICGGKWDAAGWGWKNGTCGKPGRFANVRHSWPAAKWVGIPKWWNPEERKKRQINEKCCEKLLNSGKNFISIKNNYLDELFRTK